MRLGLHYDDGKYRNHRPSDLVLTSEQAMKLAIELATMAKFLDPEGALRARLLREAEEELAAL